MIRRARLRAQDGSGAIQKVHVAVNDTLDRDNIERFQDYGFACNPSTGEGITIEIGGHLIVLRMDQTGTRPKLELDEVSVWHKEGHAVTLKTGKLIVVDCDEYQVNTKRYKVNASESAGFETPKVTASGAMESKTLKVSGSGVIDGVNIGEHDHGNVQNGPGRTNGPSKEP